MKFPLEHLLALLLAINSVISKKCKCTCESDSNSTMEGYIVGGNFTAITQFPHSVAMFVYPVEIYFCGGSVLNQNIILTAAHCIPLKVLKKIKYKIYIMAGHEEIQKMDTARYIRDFIYHAEYDEDTVENDIALLFLEKDLQFGPTIKRVGITREFPKDSEPAYVAGWGLVDDETKVMSMTLKYTAQHVIPLSKCQVDYNDDWLPGMMCGGDPESMTDRPSKGDSGSALITSEYHQIGLVSYRNPEQPGLIFYSNVSYYYDWIDNNSMLVCLYKNGDNRNETNSNELKKNSTYQDGLKNSV